jgi:hypothetical protein
MLKDKVERINWRDRSDFPFRKPLDREMLKPEASVHLEKCRLNSQARTGAKVIREVVYDSDYVAAKIARDIFQKLRLNSWEEAEWVIKAAWDEYLWEEFKGEIKDVKKQ